jgi:hypothetical protein
MDEKKKSVSSNALKWGLLVAAVGIIYSLILYILDLSMNKWLSNVTFIFYIAGMIVGTIQYRKQQMGDFMAYSQAVKSTFLIGLFSSILLAIYSFIFLKFIDPGMIDTIIESSREQIVKSNPQLSDDQVDKALSISRYFTNVYVIPLMSIIMSSLVSIIIALILSIFIKKEDPQAQSNTI